MLMFTGSKLIYLVIALLAVWAWQNYKHYHQYNPLITNVIKNQNDHRDISRPWDTFDMARNLQAKQKSKAKRTKKAG